MKKLLRYNGRHRIFFPRGFEGKTLPQLNPICSSSHGAKGKRTWSLNEPSWLYRLRRHAFCHAGYQRCPRRGESMNPNAFNGHLPTPDRWDIGPDGFRTCSYCGSLHWDDFMQIVRIATKDDRYRVEPSTKRYKIYVSQPDVRNASEGAIKFYTAHAPETISPDDDALYKEAVRLSNIRYEAMLQAMRERKH